MPINNITQTISELPAAGRRGVDVQTQFVIKQEDFQDHLQGTTVTELNTLKDQLNTRIGEINSTATTMNGYVDTASAGASTATTKAGEASTSASEALTSRNQAETFKNNASASATKASQWADNNYNVEVEVGKYSAKHWSTVAGNVVESTVKLTGNQTIAGVKTFNSSPVVPTPTTDTQAVNKQYVDGKYSGFKNCIINGKKVVNQRGLTSTYNSYNQDRWYKAGNNWFQGIEGDNNLISGKTYTLSFVGAATASYYVGTATSSTINAQTFISIDNGGTFTLTISAEQNLWIKFASDATGSTFNFVQLEEGSVATPFENRPYGLELSLCQRYARPIPSNFEIAFTGDYTYGGFSYTFSEMRTKPTVTSIGSFGAGGGPNGVPSVNIRSNSSLGVTNSSNNWSPGNGINYYGGFLSAEL